MREFALWLFLVGICLAGVSITVFMQRIFRNYTVADLIMMQDVKGLEHFNKKMHELFSKKTCFALNVLLILAGLCMVSGICVEIYRSWEV